MNISDSLKNSKFITYGIGEVINKIATFFFLPFAAFYMTPDEFGAAGILIPLIQSLQGVVIFGLSISLLKYYNDFPSKIRAINFNIVIFYFLLILLYLIITAILKYFKIFDNIYIGSYSLDAYVFFLLFTIIVSSTVQIILQKYQATYDSKKFVIVNTSSRIGLILLLLIAVYIIQIEVKALTLILIIFINGIIFSLYSLISLLKESIPRVEIEMFKKFIIIGLPLFINGISSYILQMNGRFILNNKIGIEMVAAYSFLYSISQFVFLAISVYNRVFLPDYYSVLSKSNQIKKYLNDNLIYSTKIISYISIIFVPIAYVIIGFYENTLYNTYMYYLPLLIIMYLPYNLYLYSTNYLAYYEKTYLTLIISVITGILSIVSNIFLIDYFGILGLFISQVLFQFIFAVLLSFLVRDKENKLIINYKNYLSIILIPTIILFILSYIKMNFVLTIFIGFIASVALFFEIKKNSYKIII